MDPEDVIFLRNIGNSPNETALEPRRLLPCSEWPDICVCKEAFVTYSRHYPGSDGA